MQKFITLVTGATGHIGKEVCKKLAQDGSDIILLDKIESSTLEFARMLDSEYSSNNLSLCLDLMEPKSFEKAFFAVKQKYGRLDCLVNCAAFYDETPGWGVSFEHEGYDAWLKVLRVNTMAPFFLSQNLYPLLKNSNRASIINVSSIYGILGPNHRLYQGTDMTNPAAYGASKGALQQITRWLSTVLSPNIRVNTVTPGGIERGQNIQFKKRYEEHTPLGRMGNEEEIAEAIAFLASTKSNYITGHNLIVDGGWSAW